MIQIILMMALTNIHPVKNAQVQPCVWPNRCAQVQTAQVQPCVWPNRCAKETVESAQVGPCVWPRVCRVEKSS